MKVVMVLVVVISASWAMLMFAPANCHDRLIFEVEKASKDTYSQFITDMRNELKDLTRSPCFGVPMLPAEDPKQKKYLYVVLQYYSIEQYSITLAINKANVYVEAYSDSRKWARFLSDAPSADEVTIFDNLNKVINLPFTSRYESIENYSPELDRKSFGMSPKTLGSRIKTLCGTSRNIDFKVEAEFVLLATQMFSEAVRFKYIELFIGDNFNKTFKLDKEMIKLEKAWRKLSKIIVEADNDIQHMGLLNYVAPANRTSTMKLVTENVTTSIGLKGGLGSLTS